MHPFSYTSKPAYSEFALAEWDFHSAVESKSLVIPDGCRDIIVSKKPDSKPTYFISDLSASAFSVVSSPGSHMRGIRLQPGVQINAHKLNAWLCVNNSEEIFHQDQLDEFCYRSAGVAEVLDCIASDVFSISCAAKQLGKSTRSLQRVLSAETGTTPGFWLALSRARKTARALFESSELSSVAFDLGFADQAHMSREMKRWFNLTPTQIRSNKEMYALLQERGYS